MNDIVTRWRPLGALDIERTAPRLALALEDWRKTWFARETFSLDAIEVTKPGQSTVDAAERWYETAEIALGVIAHPTPLVDRALDFSGRRPRCNADELKLLEQFESTMLEELVCTLAERLGHRASAAVTVHTRASFENLQGGIGFSVLDGAGHVVMYGLVKHPLVSAFGGFAQSKNEPAILDDRITSLGTAHISLATRIGQAHLPLDQILRLEPGDVIVLDTALHDGLELVEQLEGTRVGHGRIYQSGETLQFRLEPV